MQEFLVELGAFAGAALVFLTAWYRIRKCIAVENAIELEEWETI